MGGGQRRRRRKKCQSEIAEQKGEDEGQREAVNAAKEAALQLQKQKGEDAKVRFVLV